MSEFKELDCSATFDVGERTPFTGDGDELVCQGVAELGMVI